MWEGQACQESKYLDFLWCGFSVLPQTYQAAASDSLCVCVGGGGCAGASRLPPQPIHLIHSPPFSAFSVSAGRSLHPSARALPMALTPRECEGRERLAGLFPACASYRGAFVLAGAASSVTIASPAGAAHFPGASVVPFSPSAMSGPDVVTAPDC